MPPAMNMSRKKLAEALKVAKAFEAAKAAKDPLEKPAEPKPFVSRFEPTGSPSLDNTERITPEFNAEASSEKSEDASVTATAKELLEKSDEPEPFASRFEPTGSPSLDNTERITPKFNAEVSKERIENAPTANSRSELSQNFDAAKAASKPLEQPAEAKPFVSRFEPKGVPSLDNAERITPKFNEAVLNESGDKALASKGRNSEMVEKEKPSLDLKPPPKDRESIDRQAHLDDMAKDDKAAKLAYALELAKQIAERQQNQPEQSRDMGMRR